MKVATWDINGIGKRIDLLSVSDETPKTPKTQNDDGFEAHNSNAPTRQIGAPTLWRLFDAAMTSRLGPCRENAMSRPSLSRH